MVTNRCFANILRNFQYSIDIIVSLYVLITMRKETSVLDYIRDTITWKNSGPSSFTWML